MSETTKDINKVTGAIIGISFRLIIYAIAILLIYEGAVKGYEFGHEIFYASSMEEAQEEIWKSMWKPEPRFLLWEKSWKRMG